MTTSARPQTEGPDIAAIAAQNDAFRKLACLGTPPTAHCRSYACHTLACMEAEDGFMAEAVQSDR